MTDHAALSIMNFATAAGAYTPYRPIHRMSVETRDREACKIVEAARQAKENGTATPFAEVIVTMADVLDVTVAQEVT